MKRAASGIVPVIAVDRKAAKALHTQIYDAYRTAIVTGRLRPRQRIPSTRVLASELGVSRFPVLNAYAQLLAEGYFESRVGAGTVVSSLLPDQLTSSGPARGGPTRSGLRSSGLTNPRFAATRSGPRSAPRQVARHPNVRRVQRPPWLRGSGAFGVGQVAADQFPAPRLVETGRAALPKYGCHVVSLWRPDRLQASAGNHRQLSENRAIAALRSGANDDRARVAAGAGDFGSRSPRSGEFRVGGRAGLPAGTEMLSR